MRLYKRIGSRDFGDTASGTRVKWQDCLETNSIWEQSVKWYGDDAGNTQSADIRGGDVRGKVHVISEHRSTQVTPGQQSHVLVEDVLHGSKLHREMNSASRLLQFVN